jgi:hypothetical protein
MGLRAARTMALGAAAVNRHAGVVTQGVMPRLIRRADRWVSMAERCSSEPAAGASLVAVWH